MYNQLKFYHTEYTSKILMYFYTPKDLIGVS